MSEHNRVFAMKFCKVYPLYVQKAERKGRTKKEVDEVIRWLTGYDAAGLRKQVTGGNDLKAFFAKAPAMNPKRSLITPNTGEIRNWIVANSEYMMPT